MREYGLFFQCSSSFTMESVASSDWSSFIDEVSGGGLRRTIVASILKRSYQLQPVFHSSTRFMGDQVSTSIAFGAFGITLTPLRRRHILQALGFYRLVVVASPHPSQRRYQEPQHPGLPYPGCARDIESILVHI